MSLLVEIATRAEVPLESVVRVLTRDAVNDDHKGRVLAVLDHLDAEETRVLQRFALAAVYDALPLGGFERVDHEAVVAELVDDPLERPEAVRLELAPGPTQETGQEIEEAVFETAPAPQAFDPAPLVQLGSVLGELTEAVRELRHETDSERRERVDDLAVLIDLITKGWEGVDRRLGRVERQLGRLESPPPQREAAAQIEPPPVPAPPGPPPPGTPAPTPDDDDEDAGAASGSPLRQRLPLFVALAFGIAIGAAAALDLPSRLDASTVADRSLTAEAAQRAQLPQTVAQPPQAPTTTATEPAKQPSQPPARPSRPRTMTASGTASARTVPQRPAAPRTTSADRPTTTAARPTTTAQRPTTAPATTARSRTTQAPKTTTAATPAPPPQSNFTPSRNWAWPPDATADYYLVEFFRDGKPLYRARPTEARLTLPASVKFTPGVYRWRVRPGRGAPSANLFGDPIVDSQFMLARR